MSKKVDGYSISHTKQPRAARGGVLVPPLPPCCGVMICSRCVPFLTSQALSFIPSFESFEGKNIEKNDDYSIV